MSQEHDLTLEGRVVAVAADPGITSANQSGTA
ncbi:hypothetical protein M2171_001198 [Bradyrhizobium japonicum USDA 38]|nr:hypothetical protein [Bradyrhizobium japonicum USDA 38]MCS3944580.1 hypothetical protein [Bradyrhizobium japonicum]